ncbi:MAG: hypothetical protein QGG05_15600, partial [Candidatus Latescibacteria bacterium]|nr:hypothetical protein [Candidatus Latescibacterota bacterium]
SGFFTFGTVNAWAAKAPLSPERLEKDASYVITGTVLEVTTKDLESYAEFVGEGYGIVTEGSQQALQVTAQTEGLLLDPCYSGKTMAGLMAHIDRGWWTKDHTIVFLHTGGTPALFAYADELGLETPALDGLD